MPEKLSLGTNNVLSIFCTALTLAPQRFILIINLQFLFSELFSRGTREIVNRQLFNVRLHSLFRNLQTFLQIDFFR